MLPSDQVSLELQRVVNATHRDPGPPTLSAYVPKFCPLFRISGYERLGADEGVGRTSIGISGLSRPAVGTRRRCGGGPRALFYRGSPFEEPVRGNLADDRGVLPQPAAVCLADAGNMALSTARAPPSCGCRLACSNVYLQQLGPPPPTAGRPFRTPSGGRSRWARRNDELIDEAFGYLKRVNSPLTDSDRIDAAAGRLSHAQPVCPPGFAAMIPKVQTPIAGLQVADTCFYYPEDRGVSEGVRWARLMAEAIDDPSIWDRNH
jgi:hypothetical protein